MATKKQIEDFKQQIDNEGHVDFTIKYLSRPLQQYVNLRRARAKQEHADAHIVIADVIRSLHDYEKDIHQYVAQLEKELIDEIDGGNTTIYFPHDRQKVVVEKIKDSDEHVISVQDMTTSTDWNHAIKQYKQQHSR